MHTHTIRENINRVSNNFKRSDLELCLMDCLKKNRSFLHIESSYQLTESEQSNFNSLLEKLDASIPLAYILSNQPFYNSNFFITPDVLIPRPETELIISEVLRAGDLLENHRNELRVLDAGTGSGCIGLSIAKERRDWMITLSDISNKASEVALKNMKRLNVKNCQILVSDWLHAFNNSIFDIIVSNPPYIDHSSNLVQEEVLKFEPHGALFSNNRGIEDIDQIIKSAKRVLKPGGYLIIENGYDQSNEVIRILRQEDYGDIKVLMDYNNISRFTSSRKK